MWGAEKKVELARPCVQEKGGEWLYNSTRLHSVGLRAEEWEEDWRRPGGGLSRKNGTRQAAQAGVWPEQQHRTGQVGLTAWLPYAPPGTMSVDDDDDNFDAQ